MVTLGTCTVSVKGVGFLCFCQGFRYLSNLKLHFLYLAEVGANFFRKVMKSQRQKGHCATRGSETMLWPTTANTITHINLHFLCHSLPPNHSVLERVSQLKTLFLVQRKNVIMINHLPGQSQYPRHPNLHMFSSCFF